MYNIAEYKFGSLETRPVLKHRVLSSAATECSATSSGGKTSFDVTQYYSYRVSKKWPGLGKQFSGGCSSSPPTPPCPAVASSTGIHGKNGDTLNDRSSDTVNLVLEL